MREGSPAVQSLKSLDFHSLASELLGKGLKRRQFLRAPWDGFLCSAESGGMRKFPVIVVTLQRRKGDVCGDARPAALSGPAGRASSAWLSQDLGLLRLIRFYPKGRGLKSLILAFVALGESFPCSNCQLSDGS